MRGHREVPAAGGRHRKPGTGLGPLGERTGMLAVTGAVAASTTIGGAITATSGHLGEVALHAATLTRPADTPAAAAGPVTPAAAPGAASATVAPAGSLAPGRAATRASRGASRAPVTATTATTVRSGGSASRSGHQATLAAAHGPTCVASFYDEPQATASGEQFDPNAFTAAHRSLPMGTRVRVTNLATGRSVTVRINDRGPYAAGRCLDLSRAAFAAIAPLDAGVARVRYQVL